MGPRLEKSGNWRSAPARMATEERRAESHNGKVASGESWLGGEDFWRRFVDRAVLNLQGMPRRKGMTLSGGVSASRSGVLHDCRIQINRHSAGHDEQSKMGLWYSPGDHQIQCWYQNQRMKDVELKLYRHEVYAAVAGKPLSAEQFADQLVSWMLTQVSAK